MGQVGLYTCCKGKLNDLYEYCGPLFRESAKNVEGELFVAAF